MAIAILPTNFSSILDLNITLNYLILLTVGLLIAWQLHRLPTKLTRAIAWVCAIILGAFVALTLSQWYTYSLGIHLAVWLGTWWVLATALLRLRKRKTLWIIASAFGLLLLIVSFAAQRFVADIAEGGSGVLRLKVPDTDLEIYRPGDFLMSNRFQIIILRQNLANGLFYKDLEKVILQPGECKATFHTPDIQGIIYDNCEETITME